MYRVLDGGSPALLRRPHRGANSHRRHEPSARPRAGGGTTSLFGCAEEEKASFEDSRELAGDLWGSQRRRSNCFEL